MKNTENRAKLILSAFERNFKETHGNDRKNVYSVQRKIFMIDLYRKSLNINFLWILRILSLFMRKTCVLRII